jgi:hypothetical protein
MTASARIAGGLADAGVTHEQRVVLAAAAEDLDRAFDFGVTADERIGLALAGALVEVDAIGAEGFADGLGLIFFLLGGAFDGLGLRHARLLGNAVADVVDRVVTRHVLLLQEVGGVAVALCEDRDEHVGAGDFVAGRGFDV